MCLYRGLQIEYNDKRIKSVIPSPQSEKIREGNPQLTKP